LARIPQENPVARILIIDDEASIRKPLQILLERAGHEVVSAANGSEAVRFWRQRAGDMVITDIHMPEKNGLEAIIELRQIAPQTRILAMSGGDLNRRLDVLGDATLLGAVHTISKPFTLEEMLQAVEKVLGAREA
jgi:two-component system, chemotaxis family, chemotaxis protein CheY